MLFKHRLQSFQVAICQTPRVKKKTGRLKRTIQGFGKQPDFIGHNLDALFTHIENALDQERFLTMQKIVSLAIDVGKKITVIDPFKSSMVT